MSVTPCRIKNWCRAKYHRDQCSHPTELEDQPDLVDLVDYRSAFYADDGEFLANPRMHSDQLQGDLNRIQHWTKAY